MNDDSAGKQTITQLDYAPRRRGLRRRTILLWSGLALVLVLAGLAYWQQYRLRSYWREGQVMWVHWRSLNDATDPATVVYEEEPKAAEKLSAESGYARLPQGAAGRPCPRWQALKATMTDAYVLPMEHPGGAVFLHERYTPSGRRLLVYASYCPGPTMPGRGELHVLILGIGSLGSKPDRLGGMGFDDVALFYPSHPVDAFSRLVPHPEKHKLRLFAGQADPSDRTRFWFDYEVDGRRGRVTLRILDPDPTSNVPSWPRVDVVLQGKGSK